MARIRVKVSVIGAGFVGSSIAYTLMLEQVASEIVIVDTNWDKAEGEAMDIAQGAPLKSAASIRAGGYEDTQGSDLIIITAGTNQRPGETRTDMVGRNATIMKSVAQAIVQYADPETILLVVSNPVDVMTRVVRDVTGFPAEHVFGSGTLLDSARLRYSLAQRLSIDPRSVHAYILGEHGDTEFAAWSLVNIGGMGVDEAAREFGITMGDQDKLDIENATRNAAYEIINRKGATNYAIAVAASRIAQAIVRDEHSTMTLSINLTGQYGIEDSYLSVPVVVGEHGILKVLEPSLLPEELDKLQTSAEVLRRVRDRIEA